MILQAAYHRLRNVMQKKTKLLSRKPNIAKLVIN